MAKPPVNQSAVSKVYQAVIDDVINNVREAFLDDGVDEHVLQDLKTTWETKLLQSKAVDNPTQHHLAPGGISVYAPVVYKSLPDGRPMQALPMTAAGQQATLALPTNVPVIYHQKLPTTASTQAQMYTAYQPSRPTTQQPNTQTVIVAQRQNEPDKSGKPGQPSAIIQVDGPADNTNFQDVNRIEMISERNAELPCSSKTPTKLLTKFDIPQVDGGIDSSSSEEDDEDDEDDGDEEDDADEDESKNSSGAVETPLCSDDDGSDEDPVELFDTDNVVVCQYDKIHRAKARWKFNLKLGIMNLNGKDMVFQKATGEADW